MKRITYILSVLILSFIFVANTCDSESAKTIQKLQIGDKFIYQNVDDIEIARADSEVVVYRLWTQFRYHYYSTTRKDSIIYSIRSIINSAN